MDLDKQLRNKNSELYILLLRTFGVIMIAMPIILLMITEFIWDMSMVILILSGIFLIMLSWIYKIATSRKRDDITG